MGKIQWTDQTLNPLTGCSHASSGCLNCYAERDSASPRLQQFDKYKGVVDEEGNWTGEVFFHPLVLEELRRMRRPRKVFMPSMSDPFHAKVEEDWLHQIFAAVAITPHVTVQMLTKRSERMRQFFSDPNTPAEIARLALVNYGVEGFPAGWWPLQNLWMGVSVENQAMTRRIRDLRDLPVGVRWLSCEPLLEAVDLGDLTGIDWVVVGGESGPGARLCDSDWILSIVRQCRAAGVAPFVKQLGEQRLLPIRMPDHPDFDALGPIYRVSDRKGGKIEEFPPELQVREFPGSH